MTQAEHEEKLRVTASETEEIKRQMMQFEFQHKKDIADAERKFEARQLALDARQDRSQRQLNHLIQLVGLTDDELDEIDAVLTETGGVLTRPRKSARVK